MRPYGQRAPKPSTPTRCCENNRTGRAREKREAQRCINLDGRDWAITPAGSTIADLLEERGMSASDLARDLKRSEAFVERLIEGRERITGDVASALASSLGSTAAFWLRRDRLGT